MKRVFYITDEYLCVYQWQKKQCIAAYCFNSDTNGFSEFKAYLLAVKNTPTRLLLDLINEDFKTESIPHVSSRDKKSIIDRLLNNHYRDNKHYTHSVIIGREEKHSNNHRRDVLRTNTLRNTKTLQPWLDIMLNTQTAISGIWSLPLLSQKLTSKLNITSSFVLLVSIQNIVFLRQTFVKNNQVVSSRLAVISSDQQHKISSSGQCIYHEVKQTHLFLLHNKQIRKDESLAVHVICNSTELADLKATCIHIENIQFYIHCVDDITRDFGLCLDLDDTHINGLRNNDMTLHNHSAYAYICSALFLPKLCIFGIYKNMTLSSLLDKPVGHYGKKSFFECYYLQRSKKMIYVSCVLLFMSSSVISINKLSESFAINADADVLHIQIEGINTDDKKTFSPIEEEIKKYLAMQSTVLLVEKIKELKNVSPLSFMSKTSQDIHSLDASNIEITKLSWSQYNRDNLPESQSIHAPVEIDLILADKINHYASISGRITAAQASIKASVKTFNRFKSQLNKNPAVKHVSTRRSPFSIDSNIEVNTNKIIQKVDFEISVLMQEDKS